MELNPLFKSKKVKRDVNDRAGIIGGSGAGACLGFSTYQSEYEAWQRFMGVPQEVSEETQEIFDMGHELEDFIAQQIMRVEGIKVQRDNYAHQNCLHPFLICHPDRIVVGLQDGKRVGVEIKSSSAFDKRWGDPGTDEVPMDYLIQCYMYFICGVCEEVWLYRFSNNRLTKYLIEYDEKRALVIMDKLVEWVKKVKNGYEPQPTTYKEASAKWNLNTEGDLEADDVLLEASNRLKEIKAEKKELDNEEDELKAKIVAAMDGKERLMSNGVKVLTYKQVSRTSLDTKRIKKEAPEIYEKYGTTSTTMMLALAKEK